MNTRWERISRRSFVKLAAGAFTNLTQDHLDYHGSMDAYRDAKKMLFTMLPPDAVAVMNADDPASQALTATVRKSSAK